MPNISFTSRSTLFLIVGFFSALNWAPNDVSADLPLDLRQVSTLDGNEGIRRDKSVLIISVAPKYDSVLIPRIFASLVSSRWSDAKTDNPIDVHPQPDHWVLKWKNRPESANEIRLEFDVVPTLAEGNQAARQLGDGRINLHAYQAVTKGDKLLFEPQPHKNTVGYWVDPSASATWSIDISKPGKFNVGVLQGCGEGQGGSEVQLTIAKSTITDGDEASANLTFNVEETGHFQNFKWRTVGVVTIAESGEYRLTLQPNQIAANAVMDVRQIQLIPLPK